VSSIDFDSDPKYRTQAQLVMRNAESLFKPKALRHAFAVEAGQKGLPLNIVQRWLGHARIETTAIYANAVGKEERDLAEKMWSPIADIPTAKD
jgi:site-specific recombinase XerD